MKRPTEIEVSPLFHNILNETSLESKLYVKKTLEIAYQLSLVKIKNMKTIHGAIYELNEKISDQEILIKHYRDVEICIKTC